MTKIDGRDATRKASMNSSCFYFCIYACTYDQRLACSDIVLCLQCFPSGSCFLCDQSQIARVYNVFLEMIDMHCIVHGVVYLRGISLQRIFGLTWHMFTHVKTKSLFCLDDLFTSEQLYHFHARFNVALSLCMIMTVMLSGWSLPRLLLAFLQHQAEFCLCFHNHLSKPSCSI